MVIVRHCREADKEHNKSQRQYAHTCHIKNDICVAKAFTILPLEIQMGLIAHEVGHLMTGCDIDHTEEMANATANKFFGIRMQYRDFEMFGEHLEVLSKKETYKVFDWVNKNVIFKGL